MKSYLSILIIVAFSISIILVGSCKNKPQTICRMVPQQDGTVKKECTSTKEIEVDGEPKSLSLTKGSLASNSFVFIQLNREVMIIDKNITLDVTYETDTGYKNRDTINVIRSEKFENMVKMILEPNANVFVFVAERSDEVDNFLKDAIANAKSKIKASLNYAFNLKSITGKPITLNNLDIKFWEKVPGQPLTPIPTELCQCVKLFED